MPLCTASSSRMARTRCWSCRGMLPLVAALPCTSLVPEEMWIEITQIIILCQDGSTYSIILYYLLNTKYYLLKWGKASKWWVQTNLRNFVALSTTSSHTDDTVPSSNSVASGRARRASRDSWRSSLQRSASSPAAKRKCFLLYKWSAEMLCYTTHSLP